MPYAEEYSRLYHEQIKPGIAKAGFQCFRVDEVAHNRRIQETTFELVEKCKAVVFLADGANANAYYEAGFADAMRKEVLIIVQSVQELKFDVSHRNTIAYGLKPKSLAEEIGRKLKSLRLSHPVVV